MLDPILAFSLHLPILSRSRSGITSFLASYNSPSAALLVCLVHLPIINVYLLIDLSVAAGSARVTSRSGEGGESHAPQPGSGLHLPAPGNKHNTASETPAERTVSERTFATKRVPRLQLSGHNSEHVSP